jgi:hypothetical protein
LLKNFSRAEQTETTDEIDFLENEKKTKKIPSANLSHFISNAREVNQKNAMANKSS